MVVGEKVEPRKMSNSAHPGLVLSEVEQRHRHTRTAKLGRK